MARPTLLTVDDDPEVLRAVERDLRRRYGDRYRVLRADSGAGALDLLRQLQLRNEPVALLLADQRMPGMTGVEFLAQARPLFPEAKRALLTAYADTEAAIRAINQVQVDYYLMKPWDPPSERLYPVLDDLLEDWQAKFRPPFEGIRVLGLRWSPRTHEAKDFLARHQVPYEWADVEADPAAHQLAEAAVAAAVREGRVKPDSTHGCLSSYLPVVLLPGGKQLLQPDAAQLAEAVGLQTRSDQPFYDVIILGAGPAGLAAAVYGASEGLKTLLVEREAPGGQAGSSSRIENYLGFPAGLSGADLARRAVTQARRFGTEILSPQVATSVRAQDATRYVRLADGTELGCHALLIATGVSWRRLEVPGLDQLNGAGVYYGAAATEAISCRDQDVYVVGGANSAGQAAMYLSQYARRITMLVRGESLAKTMSQYLVDQIRQTPNIDVRPHAEIVAVDGQERLEHVTIQDTVSGQTETLPAVALFIFIGALPRTEVFDGVIERDERGFILSGGDFQREKRRPRGWNLDRDPYLLETSVPGIFVAGDVRRGSVKRVASAVGEGSIAIELIHQYLGTYAT